MMRELNNLAAKTLLVQHKIIEIFRAAPRFVSNYLQVEHEQKTIEKWSSMTFREIIPVKDFSTLPDRTQAEIADAHV